ncbi:MAG: bifunctional phosphoglucose/phosphomannose isomerase [Actinobacteria bacterium]|nr:bifunctional phosphoglucose/phosphomannose isomerase [Actinomycetota bacterium]
MTEPVDSLAFGDAVFGLPEQLTEAHRAAAGIDPERFPSADSIDNVVVLGMGGSGIAGDVLAAAANAALPVPVTVLKQYRVPAFVGPRTLAFALSYSGRTEETLAMAEAAGDRGAHLIAVSRGGPLADLAHGLDGLHIDCAEVPMPRAGLGTLVAPVFVALYRVGLLPDAPDWLADAEAQLARRRDRCRADVEGEGNPARELARRIGRTIPLVYGAGALGSVAAMRWKFDVNENAKAPAFWNFYPELDHHEICSWGQHGDVTRQVFTLVELRHEFEHPQASRRFAITREIIEEALAQVIEVRAEGEGRLAQLLDLMYLGDWTSLYMAYDAGVDPGPIEAIARLKDALAAPDPTLTGSTATGED